MNDKQLLTRLSKLGFPMFEPGDSQDANETLAEIVKSQDTRLLEGFPVLLANAGENYQFDPEQVTQKLGSKKYKDRFHKLMLLSAALFSFYHLSFPWWNNLKKNLSEEDKGMVSARKSDLAKNQPLNINDIALDSERVKKLFELYFERKAEREKLRQERFTELSLEYAMSQVFSQKQKELFKKKLEGYPLTKTEQEYFSRAVKKKVVALANADLHSLAKKLLERP